LSRETLTYRLSLRIFIICISFGVAGGLIIYFSERQVRLRNEIQQIRESGNYFNNDINDYIDTRFQVAKSANFVVKNALFSEQRIQSNWISPIRQGIEGEYRSDDGISGGFYSNIKPLDISIIERFNITGEIWSRISPLVLNHFINFWIITDDGFTRVSPVKWALEWEADHNFFEDLFYFSADPFNNPKKEPIWSPVYYDSIVESWMTSLIIPLYKNNNEFKGVTGSGLPLDDLLEYLTSSDKKSSGIEFLIFDNQNNIILHPDYTEQILSNKKEMNTLLDSRSIANVDLKDFISQFNKNQHDFFVPISYRDLGKTIHGVVYPMKILNWRLVVFKDELKIYEPTRDLPLKIFIFAGVFSILLAFMIQRIIKLQIIDRIEKLTKASKDYEIGQSTTIEKERNDEIGLLTDAFLEKNTKANEQFLNLMKMQQETARIIDASTLISIIATDTKGTITQFNKGAEKLLGYKREELVGLNTPEVFHQESEVVERSRELSRLYNRKIEGFETFVYKPQQEGYEEREWTYIRKDGSYIKVYLGITPIYDDNHEIIGFLGVVMNITRRKQQEKELSQLREFLFNIIDSISSIIVVVNENKKIRQWNRALRISTDLKTVDILDKDLKEILPYMESEYALINKVIEKKTFEHHLKRKIIINDKITYKNILIYPLIGQLINGAVIHIENVTEIVLMEESLIQNEKMLSVGGLAAGMAHEINNPLAGILQTISVMSKRLSGGENIRANIRAAEQAETTLESLDRYMELRDIPKMITAIRDSGQRIAKIVKNMLSFARKSEGRYSLQSLEEIMDRSIELAVSDYNLLQKYDFRKIRIEKNYDSLIPPIPCNFTKIQQVILNILQNGAQAMFSVQTTDPCFIISIVLDQSKNMVFLSIKDNGPGMTEEVRKRILEPFFTTKTEEKGTGLGLSISYFIITENHKGTLTLETEPEKGTKFIIGLPLIVS
jgi:PAS domain S-box-containing protein